MDVAVCIATYRRPRGLSELLAALAEQRGLGQVFRLHVVVVDNDAAGSARATCDAARTRLPLTYAIEPVRGIAKARNRSVALALPDAEFLAFIDDDEVPHADWMRELLGVQTRYAADVVAGPALRILPEDAPAWIKKGSFFWRPRHPTGKLLTEADTNNVLVSSRVIARYRPPFDERLGLAGGEDRHLFARIHRDGARIVWADAAIVIEPVPIERVALRYILARAWHGGAQESWRYRDLDPGVRSAARSVIKATLALSKGLSFHGLILFQGRRGGLRAWWHLAYGSGLIRGLFSRPDAQYGTPSSSASG